MKPSIDGQGNYHVRLSLDGDQRLHKVHILVAEAFLEYDREQYSRTDLDSFVVIHKNFDLTDNRVENLEIVTLRETHERRSNKK